VDRWNAKREEILVGCEEKGQIRSLNMLNLKSESEPFAYFQSRVEKHQSLLFPTRHWMDAAATFASKAAALQM
jgi:hypothetical protein